MDFKFVNYGTTILIAVKYSKSKYISYQDLNRNKNNHVIISYLMFLSQYRDYSKSNNFVGVAGKAEEDARTSTLDTNHVFT